LLWCIHAITTKVTCKFTMTKCFFKYKTLVHFNCWKKEKEKVTLLATYNTCPLLFRFLCLILWHFHTKESKARFVMKTQYEFWNMLTILSKTSAQIEPCMMINLFPMSQVFTCFLRWVIHNWLQHWVSHILYLYSYFVILQLLENYGIKVMCILHVLLNSFLSFNVMDSNEMYVNLGLIFFM
jgi:hypothetical protein